MGAQVEPEILGQAEHEIRDQYLSAAKARTELGWRPRISVAEGLGETVAWYRGLLGAAQLAAMRPGAFLLVMSRGGIVDEAAVAAALHAGRLGGAGMDVFSREPLPAESPLWGAPNLIITPHSSGSSRQTTALAWSIFAENLGRFVRGEPLENVVDKRKGY